MSSTDESDHANELLWQHDKYLHLFIKNVKGYAIFIIDIDGYIVTWNEGAQNIKGYTEKEIVGKHISVFYTDEEISRDEPAHNLAMAAAHGRYEREGWRRRKDGSIFWANIIFTALHDDAGRLCGFAKITRDITERKEAEEQLRYLAKLLEQTGDAVISTDTSLNIVSWNKAAEKMYNYSAAEAIGKSTADLLNLKLSNEQSLLNLATLHEKNYLKGEFEFTAKHGQKVIVSASFTCIRNEQKEVTGYVGIHKDISEEKNAQAELRNSEERFRLLVKSVKDYAIFIIDPNGYILTWNEGAQHIKGYTEQEIIGKHISVFYTEEENIRGEPAHNLAMARQYGQYENEGWRQRKDGSVFWANIVFTTLCDNNGTLRGFAKITRDITERKNAELLLSRFNEELGRKVKEKTLALEATTQQLRQLSAHLQNVREEERKSIALEIHDQLGQMLTGLKMDIVWLSKKNSDAGQAVTQKFQTALSLLGDIIKAVRRISSELRPNILDDLGLIPALEWIGTEFERRSEINIHFNCAIENIALSPSAKIGVFRIYQEALNNIAKHAAAKQVNASLQIDEDKLVMAIQDDGTGFDIVAAVHKNTLGLIGMRERAMMMGGQMDINSAPGKGTSLAFTMPLSSVIEP